MMIHTCTRPARCGSPTEPIDEILVSTLDETTSRWLRADLPATLTHRFGLPVRTISVTQAA